MLREIEQVVGSGPVTSAHVERLGIVQQVLNESLRLFPTAPIIVRDILDDMEFDGVSVPAGTIGIIPIYAIHRHRSYWHDPIGSIPIASLATTVRSRRASNSCPSGQGRGSASGPHSR